MQIFDGKCWQPVLTEKHALTHQNDPLNADVKPLEKPTRDSGLSLGRAQKTIRFERLAGTERLIHFSRSTYLDGGSSVLAPISTHIS